MEKQSFTYLIIYVFLFGFLFGGSMDTYGQRARKHREGILKADSIRAQNRADSLALLDTRAWENQRITDLETPVVGCIYALTWNGQMYKDYSQAYQDIMSDNPANDSYMDFLPLGYTQENVLSNLSYWQETFRKRKDLYRRQRDLSIFAFIGVYLLSVIDAYVDAELSSFDISEDLSMEWQPALFNDARCGLPQGIGVQCNIKF